MLSQLNIYGLDKIEMAISRLQKFEPKDGYYLCFSGGKDSITIKALADMAGVEYDAHYAVTSVDPPELVQFVKTFPDVSLDLPRDKDGGVNTMWNLMPKKRMPPTRIVRWCCQGLKEQQGDNRFKVTGVRWAESANRKKKRAGLELSNTKTGKYQLLDPDTTEQEKTNGKKVRILNPIIDWDNEDVWEFIRAQGLEYCSLYDEGFKRLGCIGCPMQGRDGMIRDFARWPKYKEAYLRAMARTLEERENRGLITTGAYKDFECAQDMMDWWLGNLNE